MTPKMMMGIRLGLILLMAGTALGGAAKAQGGFATPYRESAGDALTRHLRTIADQPRNVAALTGAGRAALQLGDPQAALTFFARAEEIAPRDGRIKAGMGAAFVQMEQVHAGLKFFQDAVALGVPEAEFAGDRGLAHDLSGDPRRAQADYNLALRRAEDPEVRRRLALSLAISGERDKALATIDGQLRAHDRAAWRVRSFVLALTGDAAEATRSAESVMPAQAAQMRPFFAALPALRPAERAMAVHFGHFPNDGRSFPAPPTSQYASAAPASSGTVPARAQQVPSARQTPGSDAARAQGRRSAGAETKSTDRPPARRDRITEERYDWTGRFGTSRGRGDAEKPAALANAGTRQPGSGGAPQTSAAGQTNPSIASAQPRAPAAQPKPQQQATNVRPQSPSPTGPPPQPLQVARAEPRVPPEAQLPAAQSAVPAQGQARPSQSATQAPAVQPPASQRPSTQTPVASLQPPATQPPATQPPVSRPPVPAPVQPSQPVASAQLNLTQPSVQTPSVAPGGTAPTNSGQAPTVSGQAPAVVVPGIASPPVQSVPAPGSGPASSGIRSAELAPSLIAPGVASSPVTSQTAPLPLAQAPAQADQPARQRSLAAIAEALDKLASDTAQTPAPPVTTSPQMAANSVSKPAYGPRFETTAKPTPKAEPAKKATGPSDQSAKKQAPAKEDAGKAEASARKDEAAKKLAKKEEPAKPGAKKEEPAKPGAKKEEPAAKQPSRHWVQIAGGANEAAMTREFLRLKTKAPKLLAARTAWTTPLRATNRLLVGPFKSSEEAQDFVNELAKLDLPAFSWTSPAGQEIVKLASK